MKVLQNFEVGNLPVTNYRILTRRTFSLEGSLPHEFEITPLVSDVFESQ